MEGRTLNLVEVEGQADQASGGLSVSPPSPAPLTPRTRKGLKKEEQQWLPHSHCLRLCVCSPLGESTEANEGGVTSC